MQMTMGDAIKEEPQLEDLSASVSMKHAQGLRGLEEGAKEVFGLGARQEADEWNVVGG